MTRIPEPLKFLSREGYTILEHHERYNGQGHPRGLKQDQISLEASIVSVADTFDAMNFVCVSYNALSKVREVLLKLLKKIGSFG